ncbi:Uncharacterised protein [Haemophilus parahaemolyticus]|uniref:PIN domain-containing protein n=1 Tax=Haemophilus parahaemolyticus TaxID=735 RepID=A0A377I104_HAEPH|nr:Uncharacterised protein [Haemophilus parahaemolyticus]
MYMLDTNTMSYFFRKVPSVVERLQQLNPDIICISSVTAAELFYSVAKRNNQQLSRFLDVFFINHYDFGMGYKNCRNLREIAC